MGQTRPHPGPSRRERGTLLLTNHWPPTTSHFRLSEVIHCDDMRMAEHGHCPSFARKSLGKSRLLADLRSEDFQRHQPIEPLLRAL